MGRRTSGGDTLLLWWLHSSQVTFHSWRSEVRPRRCPHSTEAREAGRRRLSPGAHAAQVVTLAQAVDGPWRPGVPGGWPGPLPPALRPHLSRSVFKRCLEGPRTSWLPPVLVIPGTSSGLHAVCAAGDGGPLGPPRLPTGPRVPETGLGLHRESLGQARSTNLGRCVQARAGPRPWPAHPRSPAEAPTGGTPQSSERGRGA